MNRRTLMAAAGASAVIASLPGSSRASTTYFSCTYRPYNLKAGINFSTTTALYVGPNPPSLPRGEIVGKPVEWADGIAHLHRHGGTYPVQMTKEEAQTLGNCLSIAEMMSQQSLVAVYTGGIVATSFEAEWANGPVSLYSNAPTSANFGNNFVALANWLIANPMPTGQDEPDNGITNLNLFIMMTIGFTIGGPVGELVMAAAGIGMILAGPSNPVGRVSVSGQSGGGQMSDPATADMDGSDWADDEPFTAPNGYGVYRQQYIVLPW